MPSIALQTHEADIGDNGADAEGLARKADVHRLSHEAAPTVGPDKIAHTHDLLANLLSAVEVTVDRIVVTSLSNEVFYARILAQVDGRRLEIDSRPSDAIAVAVRVGAGIFVADEVLDKAGVLPEADKDGELSEADPESEERLAKIRDWVNTLNLPDLGTGASES